MKIAQLYRERFPDCRHSSDVIIRNCALRGYLYRHQFSQDPAIVTLEAIAINPHISIRQIGLRSETLPKYVSVSLFSILVLRLMGGKDRMTH